MDQFGFERGGDNYDQSVDQQASDEQNPREQEGDYENSDDESGSQKSDQEEDEDKDMDQEFDDNDFQEPEQQNILNEDQIDEKFEPNKERITTPFLTKYEKARVIGVRAVQISKNAPLYYNFGDNQNMDPLSIAQRQLAEGKIPFIICRYLPDGSFQHWKLSQLKMLD